MVRKKEQYIDIDGIKIENKFGWWLIRASNTQNKLVVMAESSTKMGFATLKRQIEQELLLSNIQIEW